MAIGSDRALGFVLLPIRFSRQVNFPSAVPDDCVISRDYPGGGMHGIVTLNRINMPSGRDYSPGASSAPIGDVSPVRIGSRSREAGADGATPTWVGSGEGVAAEGKNFFSLRKCFS